jgi:hypothetical protein
MTNVSSCQRSALLMVRYGLSSTSRTWANINITDCCSRRLLSTQPDFIAQECELVERLQCSGMHRVIFYPKYHCEVNHIERFWCHSKQFARENCDYTFRGLQQNVPSALAHVSHSTILGNYNRGDQVLIMHRANRWLRRHLEFTAGTAREVY